jgi:hypothetical protein
MGPCARNGKETPPRAAPVSPPWDTPEPGVAETLPPRDGEG